MNSYKELLEQGNKEQLNKLLQNDSDKEGWDNINTDFAIERIEDELEELKAAHMKTDIMRMIEEAADIANFAHMLIWKCNRIVKTLKKTSAKTKILNKWLIFIFSSI